MTLTATVTAAAPSAATPTGGTVTFMDDGISLGTVPLSGGTATLATTAIAVGAREVVAIYNGDGADFSASVAGSLVGATITTVAGDGTAGRGWVTRPEFRLSYKSLVSGLIDAVIL